ncbi:MAG: UDP-N-acetylglucosamine--N-acetylmuramyl-(pentapeptide) pyrophosphoryl-undecaprenol N-acetylglucosamine transferase [Lewinella sp.]|nr:UDP-N-acetylglucosamine--N-acetylmuramyl-(pentapeptide) pyrophosphoryl-undecaprenol N-acetylglucosamine transferase [Lewinella sp.]
MPQSGYRIEGLPISGLQRKLSWANLAFPFRLLHSVWRSRQLIRQFRPDVVVGTGGYAGAPVLYVAARLGIPTLIQEPNAFAGLANKWLGRRVDRICVAFSGMEQFFPADKIVVTGNPVREQLLDQALALRGGFFPMAHAGEGSFESPTAMKAGLESGGLVQGRILLMGGSGGALSLNRAMAAATEAIAECPKVNWVWQCGKNYYEQFRGCATAQLTNVKIMAFLDAMDQEYAAADLIIGRAGSTTIAEIQYLGLAAVLVPSPWVTDDHQTKNAQRLAQVGAALLLPDAAALSDLVPTALALVADPARCAALGAAARAQAQPGAVGRIVSEVLTLLKRAS